MLGDNVAAAVHYLNEEKVAMNFAQPVVSPLNTVLERFANLEKTIGHMVAVNEGELQAFVSSDTPLSRLLAEDVPAVAAAKKDLEQLFRKHSQCQTALDKEQRRLDKMSADEEGADPEALLMQKEKRDRTAHELEMLTKDVQLDQDRLASTLLTLTSRENRYAQSVYEIIRIKMQFYENAFKTIEAELPNIQRLLVETNVRPVFGEALEDHLRATGRRIALPVALSVACLLDSGLGDEGLFRISAKQIKIDKFKAALDSRASVSEMLLEGDSHLYASLIKSYLRELPDPLLGGGATYDRWLRASRLPSLPERLASFRDILLTEHSAPVRENIQYVIKFLHELSCRSEETKMTPRNISIVLGPTLLWANRTVAGGDAATEQQLMEQSNLESVIGVVSALIEHYSHVFPDDIELRPEADRDLDEIRMEVLRLTEGSHVYDGCNVLPAAAVGTATSTAPALAAAASSSAIMTTSLPSAPPERPPPPPGAPPPSSASLLLPGPTSTSKSLFPESPSPNQRRKPSMRGVGGRLMNNPVGRNIMSKIVHPSASSSAQSASGFYSSAPPTPNAAASSSQASSQVAARHSLQEYGEYLEEEEAEEDEEEDEDEQGGGVYDAEEKRL